MVHPLEHQVFHLALNFLDVLLAHRIESFKRLGVAFVRGLPQHIVLGHLVDFDTLLMKTEELVCNL